MFKISPIMIHRGRKRQAPGEAVQAAGQHRVAPQRPGGEAARHGQRAGDLREVLASAGHAAAADTRAGRVSIPDEDKCYNFQMDYSLQGILCIKSKAGFVTQAQDKPKGLNWLLNKDKIFGPSKRRGKEGASVGFC